MNRIRHFFQKELILRTLTALVGAPLLIAAIIYGTPLSDILFMAIGAAGLYEWSVMTGNSRRTLFFWWAGLCLVPMVFVYSLKIQDDFNVLIMMFLFFFIFLKGAVFTHQLIRTRKIAESLRVTFGVFLIVQMVLFSAVWGYFDTLRFVPLIPLVFVWVVDTGAYAVGRVIGGPKLCPGISPGKTWSGFVGGVLFATIAVFVAGYFWQFKGFLIAWKTVVFVALMSVLYATISQVGDLLESAAKRFYGVKDSGNLLPGHGGVLDRFDGYALVILGCPLLLVLLVWGMTKGWIA